MLGFVVRRLRGRLPLAAAVLLTVLITTTVLTALFAFTRGVGDAGLRQALQGPGLARGTVLVTGSHPAADRAKDDEAVRGFARELFGPLPAGAESVARSRSYGLPGPHTPGKDSDLTLLATFAKDRVRLLTGTWPQPVAGPVSERSGPVPVAVPKAALDRLGLAEGALPAQVRLADRYGGPPLTVLVTGVYRAADPDSPYWRLDPLGARGLQVAGFTTYGPLLVDDSAFTAGGLVQDSRAVLLTADFSTVDAAGAEAVHGRAAKALKDLQGGSGLAPSTELPALLGELRSGLTVARSTLLVGALQLAVLAGAALLLVSHLLTERQEGERALLAARGASRGRLGVLTAAQSLLLALPAALLAPLLTPPLLRLLGGYGSLAHVPFTVTRSWLLWPVAAVCALGCVVLTTLPVVLRGAAAAATGPAAARRSSRRRPLRRGPGAGGPGRTRLRAALPLRRRRLRPGRPLRRAVRRGPGPGRRPDAGAVRGHPAGAAAAALRGAARRAGRRPGPGSGSGARRLAAGPWPGRATGPVLLLVLAVSSGVLALGQHTAWSESQRDQADFTTAGGLLISNSDLPALGRGGRYAALPGGDRVLPVLRARQELPGGRPGQLMALDAAAAADRLALRSDLRDGRSMRELFTPLAHAPAASPSSPPPASPSPASPSASTSRSPYAPPARAAAPASGCCCATGSASPTGPRWCSSRRAVTPPCRCTPARCSAPPSGRPRPRSAWPGSCSRTTAKARSPGRIRTPSPVPAPASPPPRSRSSTS
ncbi:hypothetical protein M8Z33_04665 [Streptomyces sp. ZAF1911]|uniref:hypothetical protein n=1 Tax=Streptomyces sp. ZAF1911 TaxID=2944129 RepID=UPI00237A574C|nr:hypothetical protein [Streptomyces sp. ZAF1911]MDD9375972.1 hypothetical protein [Streptomyces sp. ZAF1911]